MKRLLLIALSALALVACGSTEDRMATAVGESSAAPGQQRVTQTLVPVLPPVVEGVPTPAPPRAPASAVPVPMSVVVPPAPVACLEMASPTVTAAVASVPRYFPDSAWVAYEMGDACAPFTWVSVTAESATASTPDHHLFFADGVYLGTATAEPYSFSSVSGQTADTITIGYRWLAGDEPFADPQGGPAFVRYQWDGSTVTMLDDLPTEVANP